jgi:hypothetical protein
MYDSVSGEGTMNVAISLFLLQKRYHTYRILNPSSSNIRPVFWHNKFANSTIISEKPTETYKALKRM